MTQTIICVGRVIVPAKGPIRVRDCRFGVSPVNYPDPDPDRGQHVFIMEKFLYLLLFRYMFGNSASYLFEMTVLISLEVIQTQTRIGAGLGALSNKGPMRGNIYALRKNPKSFRFILNISRCSVSISLTRLSLLM